MLGGTRHTRKSGSIQFTNVPGVYISNCIALFNFFILLFEKCMLAFDALIELFISRLYLRLGRMTMMMMIKLSHIIQYYILFSYKQCNQII